MTENTKRSQLDAVDDLSIAQLKAAVKLMKISAGPDWEKEDYIKAIKDNQTRNEAVGVVIDDKLKPRPGFSRIMLHRDPTPKAKNSPIPIGYNGQMYLVPRGIKVDVPKEFVGVLNDAQSEVIKEHSGGSDSEGLPTQHRQELNQSYPFQVYETTPGQWKNPNDGRSIHYALREEFLDKFGHWPTAGELKEAQKARLISQMK